MSNISVVIPCYPPHIKYLRNTIIDIANQTLPPKEIILAISGINKTLEATIYNKFNKILQDKNMIFKIISTNLQQYAGINRNMGVKLAECEYIMFIDADDNIHPQKIEIIKYYLDKYNPNVLIHNHVKRAYRKIFNKIITNYTIANVTTNDHIRKATFRNSADYKPDGKNIIGIRIPRKNANVTHGYPTVKKSIFETISYTNMKRAQDCVFLTDILWNIGGMIHVNLKLVNIRPKK